MKEPKKIEYVNKRGKVVHVWPWTLNRPTTLYSEELPARYVPASRKG